MKAIDKKLLRDLVAMRGQGLAIGAVVACGIAVFVMSMTTLRSLEGAKSSYFAEKRSADLFASLVRAPSAIAARAEEIDGVAAVDHRVIEAMTLDMPGMPEPATGRVVSLPEREGTGLNQIFLKTGRWPEPGREGEVIVAEPFAIAHGLVPGSSLDATLRGRRQLLTVVGIALSPEYLMSIQPGSLFPDDKRYGVFWMARRQLEAAADMKGAFNDLNLLLASGANAEEVIRKVDRLLEPYGGGGAYTRHEQLSARYISDEIQGLRTMGVIPPAIFLGVAAFLLNISLRRILALQREQIAALKAFGYTDFEVGWHYAKLIAAIVLLGSVAGCLLGTWLAGGMTAMYRSFYKFPVEVFAPGVGVYLTALGLAAIAGFLGVFGGVRATVALPPAEAMSPAPPATYKQTLFERLGLQRFVSQPARIVVREIERRPLKALFTALGISFACAIMIVGNFGKDSIDKLLDFQFNVAERDDARVMFVEAVPGRALSELESVEGVMRAEPFRMVGARLRHGPRSKQLGITGIAEGGELFRLLDKDAQRVPLGGEGLVLSSVLGKILNVGVGDTLQVEVLEGERLVREVQVTGFVEDFAGTAAYMNLPALNRLLREGRAVSGAYLQLDDRFEDAIFADLKDRPMVAGVTLKRAMIAGFVDTFAENLLRLRLFNIIFASVIAIGVVYSSARISFSERGRDLATLRVIGLTRGEVSGILLGELWLLTLVAIPIGMLIGFGLCAAMAQAMQTELYRIPMVVNSGTFGMAAIVVLVASLFSGLIMRRKIDSLDMVTALKVRE